MLLKIAVVFNFILLVIQIHCFWYIAGHSDALFPIRSQPAVYTLFIIIIIITREISLRVTSGNRTNYKFLLVYVLADNVSGEK